MNRGSKQKKNPQPPSSQRHSAPELYKRLMGEAVIPRGQEGRRGRDGDEGTDGRKGDPFANGRDVTFQSFVETYTPLSQVMHQMGHGVCLCPITQACSLTATLHRRPCTFCHGLVGGASPYLLRHYPGDWGWCSLREKAIKLRRAAGLDDLKEELQFRPH